MTTLTRVLTVRWFETLQGRLVDSLVVQRWYVLFNEHNPVSIGHLNSNTILGNGQTGCKKAGRCIETAIPWVTLSLTRIANGIEVSIPHFHVF